MKKISFILTLLIFVLLSDHTQTKPLQTSKVVIALNCGSKTQQVPTSQGNFKYVPDQSYVKGPSVDVDYHNDAMANQAQIKFALDKQLYMYQRHTYQQMTYQLPVRKGKNTIIVKFAQMYFKNKGQRIFNIKIGSKIVIENFDVIQKAGQKYAAHEQYIEIDVRNDGLYFGGVKVNQGVQNNKIKLSFVKGKADNPIVQGIIVYHDSVQNSPKQEFQLLKSKWNSQQQMLKAKKQEKELKQLIQIQKKKQKMMMRNDQLVVQEESQQTPKPNNDARQKYGLIRNLLMGPIGIIFWSIAFAYVILFIKKSFFRIDSSVKLSKAQ